MRYREHRGGLQESVATTITLADRQALIAHVRQTLDRYGADAIVNSETIRVVPYGGNDDRIGWKDVHMVAVEGWGVVGYCEGLGV